MAVTQLVGASIQRREDPRLVTGHGRFVDDMTRPGMVHMTVVRSPLAHAKIRSIDPSAAKKAPGVLAVYTYADFKDHITGGLPVTASFVADKKQVPNQFPIAHDEVVYQGEPVAVVVATERYQAADAAALVEVDYDPLPSVMDIDKAMEPGSPAAHRGPRQHRLGSDLLA
jgi:carbon-monoxide dehydrogenase large subunit